MAYPQVGPAHQKLSFAKIAALPAPSMQPALPNNYQSNKPKSVAIGNHQSSGPATNGFSARDKLREPETTDHSFHAETDQIRSAMEQLDIATEQSTGLRPLLGNNGREQPSEDSQSQASSSSLKQQSFDTTSVASIATFAMDEKESIRPDDSASVRAAEDDDVGPTMSRHSSFQHDVEVTAHGQRPAARGVGPGVTIAARRYPGLTLMNPPRFGDLPVNVEADAPISRSDPSSSPASTSGDGKSQIAALNTAPDEKLLEALASPKDRLPLLQLEEKIMAFVVHSRDNTFELPPQNSFNRLLTHKLADYYGLAHQVNEDNSSVRIFRTSSCSMPLSLAEIAKSIHLGPQPISAATQIKIMRRVQLGRQFSAGNSTAASSSVPSKATSETGLDYSAEDGIHSLLDNTSGRDKPKSREEREAQYRAVRERIFGDFQESVTSESGSTGETSASMSRSSSTSGSKKKSRKQKTPKDDSFTRRSEFVAYGPMHMQQNIQPAYQDMTYSDFHGVNINYAYGANQIASFAGYESGAVYGHNPYPLGNGQISRSQGNWENGHQSQAGTMYNIEVMQPVQQLPGMLPQMREQFPATLPTMPPSPAWTQTSYSNNFHQSSNALSNSHWQSLSANPNMPNSNFQYPALPNPIYSNATPFTGQQVSNFAYSPQRSLFNPQTRSFVPNNTSSRGNGRGTRKKPTPTDTNNRFKEPASINGRTAALRDSSNPNESREDSLQQKYGAPANLPKKPPPPQATPLFSGDASGVPLQGRPHTPASGSHFMVGGT